VVIARGDICWVDLGPIVDRVPAKRRPVLVVQSDHYTRSRLSTVIVAAITSTTERAGIPGNVFVPEAASGLPKDSVVIATEVVTLDRDRVGDPVGTLPPTLMRDVDAGLRRALSL
jgi:mRNA interferase MazF